MSEDTSESWIPFTSIGGVAAVSGVVCCVGLKLIGGAVLFSGIAATVGLTTDQITFLVGGISGLLLAVLLFWYRDFEISSVPSLTALLP